MFPYHSCLRRCFATVRDTSPDKRRSKMEIHRATLRQTNSAQSHPVHQVRATPAAATTARSALSKLEFRTLSCSSDRLPGAQIVGHSVRAPLVRARTFLSFRLPQPLLRVCSFCPPSFG